MKTTIISLVAIAALAAGLHAQAPAAAPGAARSKEREELEGHAEYDLYSAIIKPTATPADAPPEPGHGRPAIPRANTPTRASKST